MKLEIVPFDASVHMYLVERITELMNQKSTSLIYPEKTLRRLKSQSSFLGFLDWELIAVVTDDELMLCRGHEALERPLRREIQQSLLRTSSPVRLPESPAPLPSVF